MPASITDVDDFEAPYHVVGDFSIGVFMEIRERTIEEIKKLDSNNLMALYEIVLSMKGHESNGDKKSPSLAYLNVRESLKKVKISLSEDILLGREDRL